MKEIHSIVGEINTSLSGHRMRIISMRNENDVDVQFEDGVIIKNQTYALFSSGEILYPKFVRGEKNGCNYNYSASRFYDFTKLRESFRTQGRVFYYCVSKDGVSELYTPQKMMQKLGIEAIF